MKYKTNHNDYKNWMYKYGITTLLLLLKHFETEQEFDECVKIMHVIENQNKLLNSALETKISKKSIIQTKEAFELFNLNVSEEKIMSRSIEYREDILEEIEIINTARK